MKKTKEAILMAKKEIKEWTKFLKLAQKKLLELRKNSKKAF